MPLALVARDSDKIHDVALQLIATNLPGIIARHLSQPEDPEAVLNPEDVEVRFSDFGRFDVHRRSLEIVIFANDYPCRRNCLEGKSQSIARDLHESTPFGLADIWVWIRLAYGDFFESYR